MELTQPVSSLPVNEIFETLQGEASYSGSPSVFVRLQACPVGCPWCDTKHTWHLDQSYSTTFDLMIAKTKDSAKFATVELAQLIGHVAALRSPHVVITGGEPCLYDLTAFTRGLISKGKTVQIETSGTHEIQVDDRVFVTVSPKIAMPGGFDVLSSALDRADEIKMPVGKLEDVHRLDRLLSWANMTARARPIWLQPLSMSAKATELCMAVAADRGWRVSIQLHKVAGIR